MYRCCIDFHAYLVFSRVSSICQRMKEILFLIHGYYMNQNWTFSQGCSHLHTIGTWYNND